MLTRIHARRLREVYRSAGWPSLDVVEIELLAAGLLERVQGTGGLECVRVTDAGMQYLATALQGNRQVFSKHEALVNQVSQELLRDGRLLWTNLSLRAWLHRKSNQRRSTVASGYAGLTFTSTGVWACQS